MVASIRALIVILALGCLALPSAPASAIGGDDSESASDNPDFATAIKAIDDQQWSRAIELMSSVVAEEATNADAYNYIGYAYRQSGDFERAFANYKRALEIDPKHKGAHEYIGEAYLESGDLKRAEYHLDRLDTICFFGCPEYRDLKEAVAAYRAKHSN